MIQAATVPMAPTWAQLAILPASLAQLRYTDDSTCIICKLKKKVRKPDIQANNTRAESTELKKSRGSYSYCHPPDFWRKAA